MPDPEDKTSPPISEMIRRHQERTGESLYRVEARSKTGGPGTTQKYLFDLLHGGARAMPKNARTFSALAEGLETTELAVLTGFAVELGVPVRVPNFASRLPPNIDEAVPLRVQEALLGVLWSLSSDAPVRRFLPDDEVPDVTGDEGLLDDRAVRNRPAEGTEQAE